MSASNEQVVNTVFKWGGLEEEFRATDYVHVERFEKAMEGFPAAMEASRKLEKVSDMIKHQIQGVAAVFDTLFGEDAANKVLGPSTDLNEAFDAFFGFISFYRQQDQEAADRFSAISQKYLPNRAAKRAAAKKK